MEPHVMPQALQMEKVERLQGLELRRAIAPKLWAADYRALFASEMLENEAACNGGGYRLPPSTYRARLNGERAVNYDMRMLQHKRDEMAIALHNANMQHWSPSLLARSITYFTATSGVMQRVEGRQRRIASRPITSDTLRMMAACQPRPLWPRGKHVALFVADQTYEWVGMQKHGRRQTVEAHAADGNPVRIERMVYINSIRQHIPSTLGTLSAADLQRIRDNKGSPYTEDYNNVLIPLQLDNVEQSLVDFAADARARPSARLPTHCRTRTLHTLSLHTHTHC
jgi:hypothetical protein